MKYLLFLLIPMNLFASGFGTLVYDGTFNNSVITGTPINMRDRSIVAAQFTYTSLNAVGTCTLEASNDGVNFSTIDSAVSTFILTGGTDIINKGSFGSRWVRAICESTTTDDITLKIYMEAK